MYFPKTILIFCLFAIVLKCFGYDEEQDTLANKIKKGRLIVVASSVPLATAGVFIYFNNSWWSEYSETHGGAKFSFDDTKELKYAKGLDKLGHFWSSQVTTEAFSILMQWTGYNETRSKWYGAYFSIAMSTIVEVKDGLAPWWGFSLTDMGANILGAFYPVIQHKFPKLKNISLKWSYDFQNKSYFKTIDWNKNKSFMDDYERHTYWLAFNLRGLTNYEKIPNWLCPAIGVSAINLDGHGAGEYELFLGLDIDIRHINFTRKKREERIKDFVNYYHLPTPTLKIHKNYNSYLIKF